MENITAAVAGASGLVGAFLLADLLEDPAVGRVIAPTRRPLPAHPKLVNPIFSGSAWPDLPPLDEAYCCLGTTRAKSGSDAAYLAVDRDLTVAFARAAKAARARRFGLVTSVGSDARSRSLYLRTKGQVEAFASGMGFESTVIAAPSRAPISEGSCSSSARLPLKLASQPRVDSNGNRSTCGLFKVGL